MMPEEGRRFEYAEEVLTFFFLLEIDLAEGDIIETVGRRREGCLAGRIERLRGPRV